MTKIISRALALALLVCLSQSCEATTRSADQTQATPADWERAQEALRVAVAQNSKWKAQIALADMRRALEAAEDSNTPDPATLAAWRQSFIEATRQVDAMW